MDPDTFYSELCCECIQPALVIHIFTISKKRTLFEQDVKNENLYFATQTNKFSRTLVRIAPGQATDMKQIDTLITRDYFSSSFFFLPQLTLLVRKQNPFFIISNSSE